MFKTRHIDPADRTSAIAVAIFGSHARGDFDAFSDTDILLWMPGGRPFVRSRGRLSFSFYPRGDLLQKAKEGDLFVSHLVFEARAIWDPLNLLDELRAAYRPAASFRRIISNAAELGALLIDFGRLLPAKVVNRRIAWIARTILIAQAAELGRNIFAAKDLIEFLDARDAMPLMASKSDTVLSSEALPLLNDFLQRRVGVERNGERSLDAYRCLFAATDNQFGLKTIAAISQPCCLSDYD